MKPNHPDCHCVGVEAAVDAAFVLVAGGLGERLGYSGIKLALPSESASGSCFLQARCRCSHRGCVLGLRVKSLATLLCLPRPMAQASSMHARPPSTTSANLWIAEPTGHNQHFVHTQTTADGHCWLFLLTLDPARLAQHCHDTPL